MCILTTLLGTLGMIRPRSRSCIRRSASYYCEDTVTGAVIANSRKTVNPGTPWILPGPEVDPSNKYQMQPSMRCTWKYEKPSPYNSFHLVISEGSSCDQEARETEVDYPATPSVRFCIPFHLARSESSLCLHVIIYGCAKKIIWRN